jgi:hypothetical protein
MNLGETFCAVSTMSKPLSTLVGEILSSPAPVILWDSCALLDVMRAAYRDHIDTRSVDRSQEFLSRATTTPREIWSLASEIVEQEFRKNGNDVKAELSALLNSLDACASDLRRSGRYTGDYSATAPLASSLHDLSADLLSNSNVVALDAVCDRRAAYRMAAVIPPCRSRGSNNNGDCRIIEHYLEIARQLSAASFRFRVIFVSSNKKDYGEPSNMKYILGVEFSDAKLDYAKDAHAAASLLGM